jgi:hypothetical protein
MTEAFIDTDSDNIAEQYVGFSLRIGLSRLALATSIAVSTVLIVPVIARADLPYLNQRLENPAYKATFTKLLGAEQLPPWLRQYLSNHNGVERPGDNVTVAGKPYELYAVCEPHNCAGNFIYVLFRSGGQQAVALIILDNKDYKFFGDPDQNEKDALLTASKN